MSFSAKHWYIPESSTAAEEMVTVLPVSNCSPLWYQVMVGAGMPATSQVKVTSVPVRTSLMSSGEDVIVAGPVGEQVHVHGV